LKSLDPHPEIQYMYLSSIIQPKEKKEKEREREKEKVN